MGVFAARRTDDTKMKVRSISDENDRRTASLSELELWHGQPDKDHGYQSLERQDRNP